VLQLDELVVPRATFDVRVQALTLAPGQRVTLIGPSGGGKSTLLRALLGLEPLARTMGLRWNGRDLSEAAPRSRPFAWLPQDLGLWPHMTALAHVAFARTRGRSAQPGQEDAQVLDQLGLGHRAQAMPGELSGGERQRLAFARVIAQRPAWAVLDEPFSHLDPVMAAELSGAFQDLAAHSGMGLIQVTHQLHRPADDDWFWALEEGGLSQSGRWAEFKHSPATPWIASFVALQH
jgi:ABC-type Fe3+/spermidine/putrescine transport system ATPase subunit